MPIKRKPGRPQLSTAGKVIKLSVSLRPETAALIRQAAHDDYSTVSRFIDITMRRALEGESDVA